MTAPIYNTVKYDGKIEGYTEASKEYETKLLVQPGIKIHYSTGESERVSGGNTDNNGTTQTEITYVLNKNTKKVHIPTCSSVTDIKASNKEESSSNRETIISMGYDPCKRCNP